SAVDQAHGRELDAVPLALGPGDDGDGFGLTSADPGAPDRELQADGLKVAEAAPAVLDELLYRQVGDLEVDAHVVEQDAELRHGPLLRGRPLDDVLPPLGRERHGQARAPEATTVLLEDDPTAPGGRADRVSS